MTYLCTILDAAKLCGIPASTIRRWIAEGRMTQTLDYPRKVAIAEIVQLRDRLRGK